MLLIDPPGLSPQGEEAEAPGSPWAFGGRWAAPHLSHFLSSPVSLCSSALGCCVHVEEAAFQRYPCKRFPGGLGLCLEWQWVAV